VNSSDSRAASLTSFRGPKSVFFVIAMRTNPMANARSDHESAFLLDSLVYPNCKTVSDISQHWEFYADAHVTAKKYERFTRRMTARGFAFGDKDQREFPAISNDRCEEGEHHRL
jgi:hypothetical protein